MRTQLSKGTIVTLNSKEYLIHSVIGDGASCIVYNVSSTDTFGITRYYRMKECYPYNAQCHREGSKLVWENTAQQQVAFERFIQSAKVIAQLRNEESVGNNFTGTELYEGHGTLYAIMDVNHAQTYSHDQTESLHQILQTILKLTRIVNELHNQGFLHLDIKPENFLVRYDPDISIWLFDVDSLVSVHDLHSGNISYTSYSRGWAAPELVLGKITSICAATDLYAIGSILFNKIMKRPVTNDDIGLFAKWDFDSNVFEDTNPKVKPLIDQALRKTLSASVKHRYQNANELIRILEKACSITAKGTPYLEPMPPGVFTHIVGRDTEAQEIHRIFTSGNHIVFLRGEPGIGKTCIAIEYSKRYEKEYDAVIFLKYQDSLEELLEKIEIHNFEGKSYEKQKMLRRLLDKRVLLIVDNFDIEIDQDDYLDDFLHFKANILFTTRTDFSAVYSGEITQINIQHLPETDLIRLFETKSNIQIDCQEKLQLLHNLLKIIGHNTYVTELLAAQIAASGYSLEYLMHRISSGLCGLTEVEGVRVLKDGMRSRRTIPALIRILYQISNLNESRKQTLRNLFLLRYVHIDKKTYSKLTYAQSADIDTLNDLQEIGWARFDGKYYSLHPLVEELVHNDLKPDDANCTAIYLSVKVLINKCLDFDEFYDLERYQFEKNSTLVNAILMGLDYKSPKNRSIAIDWLHGLFDAEDVSIMTATDPYLKGIYSRLVHAAERNQIIASERFDIFYAVFGIWLYEYRSFYYGLDVDTIQQINESRNSNLNTAFNLVVQAIMELPIDKQEESTQKLYTLIANFIPLCNPIFPPTAFLAARMKEAPEAFTNIRAIHKDRLGLPLSADELTYTAELAEQICPASSSGPRAIIGKGEAETDNFFESYDKVAYVTATISDNGLTPIERSKEIHDDMAAIFDCLYSPNPSRINEFVYDWNTVEKILQLEEEFLMRHECRVSFQEDMSEWGECYEANTDNQIITAAVLMNTRLFENKIDALFDEMHCCVTHFLDIGDSWRNCIDFNYRLIRCNCVLTALLKVRRAGWIVPYLIRFVEYWESYAEQNCFDTAPLFAIYQAIIDAAESAISENDIPNHYRLDYSAIIRKYQSKIDETTDTSFSVRSLED